MPADPFFAEVLFDATPDVVFFVKDVAGRYVVVNDALVRRLGRRAKPEVLGRTAEQLFPPPLGRSYSAQDRAVLTRGTAIRDRLELHLYDDGTRGFCLTSKVPLRGRDGRIVGMAGLSRDLHPGGGSGAGGRAAYPGLARAVERIRTHFAAPLARAELARLAGMSESRFARLVRRVFHLSPGQLLVKRRVEEASRLLAESSRAVAEIAQTVGYADHSAFTRQFRATTGLTPREFRLLARRS
ncbi:MAG TPA: AraC family transcriptional regulator [Vicinamibacteria bacterium]